MIDNEFKQLVEKKDNEEAPKNRDQLVNYIVQNFYRHINSSKGSDSKSLLMLVAALSVISAGGDNTRAVTAARRLATKALSANR